MKISLITNKIHKSIEDNQTLIKINNFDKDNELILKNYGFVSIEADAFELFSQLKTLNLSENNIQIVNRSFSSLNYLESLVVYTWFNF